MERVLDKPGEGKGWVSRHPEEHVQKPGGRGEQLSVVVLDEVQGP